MKSWQKPVKKHEVKMINQISPSYKKINLEEKAAFLHERKVLAIKQKNTIDTLEKAREWQDGMQADNELMSERLHNIGLSYDEFLQILGADESELRNHQSSNWLNYLNEIILGKHDNQTIPKIFVELSPDGTVNPNLLPFEGFLTPFLKNALAHLNKRILQLEINHEVPTPLLNESLYLNLAQNLGRKLLDAASRTLVLELNIARLKGLLIGETPQERFVYFSKLYLNHPQLFIELLEEYPVLARLLVVTSQHWVAAMAEFFERLYKDWDVITHLFNNGEPLGKLIHIKAGISDSHNRGRNVIHLWFNNGLQLIYKPKPLGISVKFQELIVWLNKNGLPISQRPIKISDHENYGWVEFIQPISCQSEKEIKRFYWRQGSHLALLYLLNAVDFHYENLIAHGEYPILVDLEALFHNDINMPREKDVENSAYFKAWQILNQSVLRVGLLPQPVFSKDGRKSFDMSGLGGSDGQVLPFTNPMLQAVHTDEMRYENKHGKLMGGSNLPELKKQSVDATLFTEDIVAGFKETFDLIIRKKDKLAVKVEGFANVSVRQVLRMTRQYGMLLQESYHPDYLRNGISRDMLFDKLWAQVAVSHPFLRVAVPSEHHDLLFGDIPFFSAKPNQTGLWDSRQKYIPDFFNSSSLVEVQKKLKNLSFDDRDRQIDFIRKAMISLKKTSPHHEPIKFSDIKLVTQNNEKSLLLEAALKIGEYLQAEAIWGTEDACWIGVSVEEEVNTMQCQLSPIGTSLYQGVAGLALFFAYLSEITQRDDLKSLAVAALYPAKKHMLAVQTSDYLGIGAFTGHASLIYSCHQLAKLWNDATLYQSVTDSLAEFEKLLSDYEGNDILTGEAGAAIVLLNLYRDTKNPKALELATRCGQNILNNALEMDGNGFAWKIPVAEIPLAGFSHGVAGIVWALLELAAATGNHRFHDMACQGLKYERSLYLPQYRNWLDARDMGVTTTQPQTMLAWCHGAPGILLGRVLGIPHLDDEYIRDEVDISVKTTMKEAHLAGSHSLCHGALGNAEILHFAGERLNKSEWKQFALNQANQVAAQVMEGNWLCGVPSHIETPGLMLGLSGIGTSLLHFSSPLQVPSVLRLQHI